MVFFVTVGKLTHPLPVNVIVGVYSQVPLESLLTDWNPSLTS